MAQSRRVELDVFEVETPERWEVEEDEEGGFLLSDPDGPGLLHMVAFAQTEDEHPDPAEELYAFLEDQGIELEEDEVEDVDLGGEGELAFCEYLTEDEEADEEVATYWLVGVAILPGFLVFSNYSCPVGEQDVERELVRRILASLRTRP
jgi:hypothetical protein